MTNLHARLAFFLATDALKELQRANWVHSTARFENVAEHSWHAALLAMLFSDAAPDGTDHSHVRDLLVVHDLVEVYAGDTPIWDDVLRASEAEREALAGAKLMAMLPEADFSRFDALWREFQAQETEEARFARAIDTLHPLVMSWTEGGHGHSNTTLTPSIILERKRSTIEAYPVLWELVLRLLQGAVDRGLLPPDETIQRREVPDDK
jgi:putative hydrolase of HD superfamily